MELQPREKELLAQDVVIEKANNHGRNTLDLKARGLEKGPSCAVGDGAMGFWKALIQVYGKTRPQRCWMHETSNVLDKVPKGKRRKLKATCMRSGWQKLKKKLNKLLISLLINIRLSILKQLSLPKTEKHFSLSMTFQLTFLASSNY